MSEEGKTRLAVGSWEGWNESEGRRGLAGAVGGGGDGDVGSWRWFGVSKGCLNVKGACVCERVSVSV